MSNDEVLQKSLNDRIEELGRAKAEAFIWSEVESGQKILFDVVSALGLYLRAKAKTDYAKNEVIRIIEKLAYIASAEHEESCAKVIGLYRVKEEDNASIEK